MPQEAVTFCSLEGLASAGPLGLGFQPWMPWPWGPWRHFRGKIFVKPRIKTRRLIMCQYLRNLGTFPKLGLTKWAKNGIYWNRMGNSPKSWLVVGFRLMGDNNTQYIYIYNIIYIYLYIYRCIIHNIAWDSMGHVWPCLHCDNVSTCHMFHTMPEFAQYCHRPLYQQTCVDYMAKNHTSTNPCMY